MTDAFPELNDIPDDEGTYERVPASEVTTALGAEPMRLTLAVDNGDVPQVTLVQRKATTFVETLAKHEVTDDETYALCNDLFVQAALLLDEIGATFDPIIAAAYKAHKEACAQKAKFAKPVQEAMDGLKGRFLAAKVERDAKAETLRLELEAKLKAEADDRKLAEAVALENAGQLEEAELVFDEPTPEISVPVAAVAHRVAPKLANTSTPGSWKCTQVDLKKLAKAVADGTASENYIAANMEALHARARADKTTFNVPGCTAQLVQGVRVRR